MALIDLKSNLANYRRTFSTPSIESQAKLPTSSLLNIDDIPTPYNGRTQFKKSFIKSSLFDRTDEFILKYTGRTQFTAKYVDANSKFNRDGINSKFSPSGIYQPGAFSPTKINTSKFNIDSNPAKFSSQGKYAPSNFAKDALLPDSILRWKGKEAPVVNYLDNNKGSVGFTSKFTDPNKSNFIGISGTPWQNQFVYPSLTAVGTRLMKPASTTFSSAIQQFPGPQNFFQNSLDVNYSDKIVVDYSKSTGPGGWIPGKSTLSSQLGNGSLFNYAKNNVIVNKKFSTQSYSAGRKYGDNVKSIAGQSNKSLLFTRSTEKNSPSAITEQYKKFNLREESFNPSYIKHPLILRGIQRKEKFEPQRWGIDALTNFDDGFVRGGITTAVERLAIDTARIAKWMVSPKGLLWVVKQVGLGLSNPNVERSATSTLLGIQQTKVHTGLASLLSVPGTALGLHFTRHGIPFLNELASYENVIKTNQLGLTGSVDGNRLVKVKNELFGKPTTTDGPLGFFQKIQNVLRTVNGWTQAPILTLSTPKAGIGGPNSVYGIGGTTIRRYTNTAAESLKRAKELYNFTPIYNIKSQYASAESNGFNKTGAKEDSNKNTISNVDVQSDSNSGERTSLYSRVEKPSEKKTPGTDRIVNLSSQRNREKSYSGLPLGDINDYVTMAYHQIPKNKTERDEWKGDFRNALDTSKFSGAPERDDYFQDNNLEKRYGFGNVGQVGADRTKPLEFIQPNFDGSKEGRKGLIIKPNFRGDKVNALDVYNDTKARLDRSEVYPAGAEDLIKFYFEDGNQGINVMPFRCTMTGFSDSFSPGWDRIDIMGRPDGAYLYTSFERSISFNFIVAAMSRSEMIPMWRKLNLLASYTMPDFDGRGGRPAGPFMRLTIGSLFQQTPGFLTSLSYTIPDDATWDIAEDVANNTLAKQLPMVVEISAAFTMVGDYRPQLGGRVYSLQGINGGPGGEGDWLKDVKQTKEQKIDTAEPVQPAAQPAPATTTATT
jgi:hypothetical protein